MDGEKTYYSLRETELETGVPVSTLRYWETQFEELNPRKDGHGNRYYTREDQEVIKRIKYIRDEMKITRIEAIRKELKNNTRHSDERQSAVEILMRVREELCEIRKLIKPGYDINNLDMYLNANNKHGSKTRKSLEY